MGNEVLLRLQKWECHFINSPVIPIYRSFLHTPSSGSGLLVRLKDWMQIDGFEGLLAAFASSEVGNQSGVLANYPILHCCPSQVKRVPYLDGHQSLLRLSQPSGTEYIAALIPSKTGAVLSQAQYWLKESFHSSLCSHATSPHLEPVDVTQ